MAQLDSKDSEIFTRFVSEVKNKAFAQAFVAVSDCVTQKEFSKRVGIDETRFSRILKKHQNSTK